MKTYLLPILLLLIAGLCTGSESSAPSKDVGNPTRAVPRAALQPSTAVNVTQHHNNPSRDGLFIDPAFTPSAAANLARDVNFNGTIVGNVYAQPLYVEGGPNGPMVIVVTESNNVYALNATTGNIIWQRNVGTPASSMGNISPVGITSTPVIDLASRALYLNAVISGPNNLVYSLNVDTGTTNLGWPVDVNASVSGFSSSIQSQRGALTFAGNTVYVSYGGYFGDAGSYRGRVIGIPPGGSPVSGWATTAVKAGIWGPGGIASDGTNIYVTTGNASTTATWSGQEAVIRLQPGPVFSGATTDYWAPTNWSSLDSGDTDLGGSGPIVIDVPGASPSQLVVQTGKDRNMYLINRNNMGGVSAPVAQAVVSSGTIINAVAAYRTSQGSYVALRPVSGTLTAVKITATSPPTIATGWSVSSSGRSSPFVTSTDGTSNAIVWAFGVGTGQRLFGYNGDTGATIFAGGGANDTISGTRSFNTGIAARGRIYIAGDNKVYAFSVPVPAFQLNSTVSRKTHADAGSFDIALPGVECRSGGASNDYTLVFTFNNNLENGNASVTSGTGSVTGGPAISGNTMTVNLTGVTNAQTLTVTLNGVTDQFLQTLPDTAVTMGVLIGDASGNSLVNASDVSVVKSQIGVPLSNANFRNDVNVNGAINASDISLVKSFLGTGLP